MFKHMDIIVLKVYCDEFNTPVSTFDRSTYISAQSRTAPALRPNNTRISQKELDAISPVNGVKSALRERNGVQAGPSPYPSSGRHISITAPDRRDPTAGENPGERSTQWFSTSPLTARRGLSPRSSRCETTPPPSLNPCRTGLRAKLGVSVAPRSPRGWSALAGGADSGTFAPGTRNKKKACGRAVRTLRCSSD